MILVFLLLLFATVAQASTTVPADSIALRPADLPLYKTDPYASESEEKQISMVVPRMLEDRRGHLWFATQNGICRHDGTSLVYFDLRDEYKQRVSASTVVEDREGTVWIGSTAGLTRYDGKSFTTFNEADGLTSKFVRSLFVDSVGVIWIGTYNGVSRFDGKAFQPLPLPESARVDTVFGPTSPTGIWDITQDPAGNMWIAAEGGVYKHDGRALSRVRVTNDDAETFVTGVAFDRKGNTWFSTRNKGMIRLDDSGFTNVTQLGEFPAGAGGGVFEDDAGALWFPAGHDGIYHYDGASFTNYSKKEGLTSTPMHRIYQDRDGRIWCFGWGGVFRKDGESFVNVTRDGPW